LLVLIAPTQEGMAMVSRVILLTDRQTDM